MVTLNKLVTQIRFQLEQLSEQNGYHKFEHLCRWLVRKKICSNILPATGPVSTFGDQGRDFETFRTYLQQSPIADSSFIGLTSEGPIAFACTLTQGKGISQKIKSDIQTIMQSGTAVIDIQYFCVADIPSGMRHKLVDWAKKEKNILLEIYDGQAISELLTEQDVFWIAEEFLNIPAEQYPASPIENGDQWYFTLLEKWKDKKAFLHNYSEFSELKLAIRHSTFVDSAKKDLPFWIKQMETLNIATSYSSLKRKTTYEVAVAELRGLGSLLGYEERLTAYFNDIPTLTEPSEIDDATSLWIYCTGAYNHNVIQVKLENLHEWRTLIEEKIDSELLNTNLPGRKCLLLDTRGRLSIGNYIIQEGPFSINETIKYWLELANLVERAPLFPLDEFADRLTKYLELPDINKNFENHPDYSTLTQKIDVLLSKRFGGFIAAEKSRDRAMVFYKRGELLRAIKEIHKAKIEWFAQETLRGSILSMLFVSKCYQELGLIFSAKYYALASAFISIINFDSELYSLPPRSLNFAATCDYSIGAYCGFFDLSDACLSALSTFQSIEDGEDSDADIHKILYHSSILYSVVKRFNPELIELIDNRVKNWDGYEDIVIDLIKETEKAWADKDTTDIWTLLQDQMFDRPFSDLGKFRIIQFPALGVTWKFSWENTYELNAIGEEIISVLQILLADIADEDWYLLKTSVEVEINLSKDSKTDLKQIPSNELGHWILTINDKQTDDEANFIAFQLATTLLEHTTLMPIENFNKRLSKTFDDGLFHKLYFGQRYSHFYKNFITKEKFEKSNRETLNPIDSKRPFTPILCDQLPWFGDLCPDYSKDAVIQPLKKRYERSIVPIEHTIARLNQQQSFIDTISLLRARGWLDWHILTAISHVVLNYRVNKEIDSNTNAEMYQQRFIKLLNLPEDENAIAVPVNEFTEENLSLQLRISMLSTLKNLGFELHQLTPNFDAISEFLGKRYNYWTDDIDHPNYGF